MKKSFTIQYIHDATKKVMTAIVSGSDKTDAAIRIADQLGYAPIILSIGANHHSELQKQPVRE